MNGQPRIGEHSGENGHATTGKLKVLLAVFGFPLVSLGVRTVISGESDLTLLAEADCRESMLRVLEREPVDVVIAECLLQSNDGQTSIEAIEAIRSTSSAAKILVLACQGSNEHFSLALKAGADGFLTREAQPQDLVAAIRCISRGQTYVSPAIVTRMVNTYLLKTPNGGMEDPYESLSGREKEVLLLVAVGHTNREIAGIFHLSEQTVHNYRARLMEKLGFHDRVELLKYAVRRRIIDVDDL